eukprot:m.607651 g.607651  ORF g.607651 m.607651 type:complete len:599 (-) comp22480_c0_seq1:151-1947(-)
MECCLVSSASSVNQRQPTMGVCFWFLCARSHFHNTTNVMHVFMPTVEVVCPRLKSCEELLRYVLSVVFSEWLLKSFATQLIFQQVPTCALFDLRGWMLGVTWREAARTLCLVIDCVLVSAPENIRIIKYLVGHGIIQSINDTVGAALATNIDMCCDPIHSLLERLLLAGKFWNDDDVVDARPPMNTRGSSNADVSDAMQRRQHILELEGEDGLGGTAWNLHNPCSAIILECGLLDKLSLGNLFQIWTCASDGACAPALPEHCAIMGKRIDELRSALTVRGPRTLKALCRATIRRALPYKGLSTLNLPKAVQAYVLLGIDTSTKGPSDAAYSPYLYTSSDTVIEQALAQKHCGDGFFLGKQYELACDAYSNALSVINGNQLEALTVTLLLNRSGVYMKMDRYPEAVADCTRTLDMCAGLHTTCRQRRALALERLGRTREALADYTLLVGDSANAATLRLRAALQDASDGMRDTASPPLAHAAVMSAKDGARGVDDDAGTSVIDGTHDRGPGDDADISDEEFCAVGHCVDSRCAATGHTHATPCTATVAHGGEVHLGAAMGSPQCMHGHGYAERIPHFEFSHKSLETLRNATRALLLEQY